MLAKALGVPRLLARIPQWYCLDLGGAPSAKLTIKTHRKFCANELLINRKAVQCLLTHTSCMCQSRDCTHSVPYDSEVSVGNC